MIQRFARAAVTLATLAVLGVGCRSSSGPPPAETHQASAPGPAWESLDRQFRRIEAETGGVLGVFALDTHTGRELEYRPLVTFALCSTFKWILAAHVLQKVDRGEFSLDERISFGPGDVLEYAPVVQKHLKRGWLTIEDLAEAAVVLSDNSAANLLLSRTGGPRGLSEFVQSAGDVTTRLDRIEPDLNIEIPGDPQDTTSPQAMVGLARSLLLDATLSDDTLSLASRERLFGWLIASPTGKNRIRAGLPADWKAGDKTGTCNDRTVNDVAIVWPPEREPILIAVYLNGATAEFSVLEAAHAKVAEIVVRQFGR